MESGLSTGGLARTISPFIPHTYPLQGLSPAPELHREAVHARETGCVDRLRYMPKIHQNSADYEQIQGHRRPVQNAERARGALLGFRARLDRIFAQVQIVHARLQDIPAEQTDQEKRH